MQKSVTYMGCIISAEGISPTDEKVEAIKQVPRPENSTQLRAFLGVVNYHGKFIHNLSSILQPLNQLLQKNQDFTWTPLCEAAFNKRKDSFSSSHVQFTCGPRKRCKSIWHRSSLTSPMEMRDPSPKHSSEQSYSQIEKEGLAIIFGVTKYYMIIIYLFRHKFTLCTDHKPLLKIFEPDSATPVLAAARLQRWSLLLSSYHYDIEFKPSAKIPNADALSRLPLKYHRDASVEDTVFHVAAQQPSRHPVSASEIAREKPTMAKALSLTWDGWPVNFCPAPELKPYFTHKHELTLDQGCLMWGFRTIIPPTLQESVLDELHRAHRGIARMKTTACSHVR